jgi:hypothetical protein
VFLLASSAGCGRLLYEPGERSADDDGGVSNGDSGSSADAAPDPDLLVAIGFDGDPAVATPDGQGLLSAGTCTAGRCPSQTTGVVGGAYLFDGVDDYIQFDTSTLLDFGSLSQAFSVVLWYRALDLTPSAQQVLMAQSTAGGSVAYQLSFEPWQAGAALDLVWKVCQTDCQSAEFAVADDLDDLDEWLLVVATWDGSVTRLYIDAVEIASQPKSMITFDGSPLMVGADYETGGSIEDTFNGAIDELAIYTRVLSADEQAQLLSLKP